MVEAIDHCRLLPTSILDILSVLEAFKKVYRHINEPYAVTLTRQGQNMAILSDIGVEMMP
jgi:hypothetical protein